MSGHGPARTPPGHWGSRGLLGYRGRDALRAARVLRRDRPAPAAAPAARLDVRERRGRARVRGRSRVPATRKLGGLASAGVFVAVFPANIQMAVDWRARPRERAAVYGRLPLQLPLVLWALRVWNDPRGSPRVERDVSGDPEAGLQLSRSCSRPEVVAHESLRTLVADVQPGDRVRHACREFDVARIQSPFLGQTALVCLIEDTPTRWMAYPVGVTMEIEVLRG